MSLITHFYVHARNVYGCGFVDGKRGIFILSIPTHKSTNAEQEFRLKRDLRTWFDNLMQ